jgi:predicted RNA-binding protein with PIN domain
LSARELKIEVEEVSERVKREHQEMQGSSRNYLSDVLSPESKQQMEEMAEKERKH